MVFLVGVMLCAIGGEAKQKVTELPEVMVESQRRNMLHVIAYVREYSMLTTYSDTVSLFREKMVDFMIPIGKNSRYKGWHIPRVLKSESYFHFTDADGLDSVSNSSRHHFSWSDWMGLPPYTRLPKPMQNNSVPTDTLYGKYSPTEIWTRDKDIVSVYVNVLADTVSRKWVPTLRSFFRNEDMEFEDFKMQVNYANVLGNDLRQSDLTSFTYRVDARGRGHDMFRFHNREESFYATTDGELYILDMEYLSEKEAKKWGKGQYDSSELEVIRAADAPPLSEETLALIDRVENIDNEAVRLNADIDRSMMRMERHRTWGQGALGYLKNILGISGVAANKKRNKEWKKFREDWRNRDK